MRTTLRRSPRRTRPLCAIAIAAFIFAGLNAPGHASTEVEGAAYGGTTTGGWTCGPVGRANYGGVGARVRVAERKPSALHGAGFRGQVGVGAEIETVTLTGECEAGCANLPAAVQVGAGVRGGYRGRWAGIDLGGRVFSGWRNSADPQPSFVPFPELEIAVGPEEIEWGLLGVGSPSVTTERRPAVLYGGAGIPLEQGRDLMLTFGAFRVGPALLDDLGPRGDAVFRLPLNNGLKLRLGAALSGSDKAPHLGGELSVGVAAVLR